MKKSAFIYTAVIIQAVLCVCFVALLLNTLPRSFKLQETLQYISPKSADSGFQPIKSFVVSHPFYKNDINDSYITAALENLHVQLLTSADDDMKFENIKSSASLLSYTVYNKAKSFDVYVYYPKASSPRIAVQSKEAAK